MVHIKTLSNPYSKSAHASRIGSIWRPRWFLITRIFAVLGVAATLIITRNVFSITTIHYRALWILDVILLVTNIFYWFYYKSRRQCELGDDAVIVQCLSHFTMMQITNDLIILTLMLHFAGGATNPFILYYFFYTILSSILLTKRAVYIETSFAAILFNSMVLLEGYNIIPHYYLFLPHYHTIPTFIFGMMFALTSALYISAYMATSIMDRLRIHQHELEKSLEGIRHLEEEKSHFLDVVAHDLKSPLAAIETMVTSVLTTHKDKMNIDIKKILERIPSRTQDLLRFIQDLLEFSKLSKINDIRTDFKLLNFLPVVTATVEMYMNQALDKNITMSVQSEPVIPTIMGNQDYLEHMAANLISNAIRYTPDSGSIKITIGTENDQVVLMVADTGIGISEQALPFIFNEFYRAPNAKKFTASGTGLGLSITKAIVEKHGGTIAVQSEEGEGTVFTVRIPIASHTHES